MPYLMPEGKMLMRCPQCRTQFTYTEEDKQSSEHRFPDHIYYYTYVKCPKCGCGINVYL